MRAVVQRVSSAQVLVGGEVVGAVADGLLVLVGVAVDDTDDDAGLIARKVVGLRIFADGAGRMNVNVVDRGGSVLVVSQFTLVGDVRKGRRPSFAKAAQPEQARELVSRFVEELRGHGVQVATGEFGAHMEVELVNDGPVTILIESRRGAIV